jgi:hypothetical protein
LPCSNVRNYIAVTGLSCGIANLIGPSIVNMDSSSEIFNNPIYVAGDSLYWSCPHIIFFMQEGSKNRLWG